MHAGFGAGHHQGIRSIVAGVAEVAEFEAFDPAEMLTDGEQVRQHLGGMELIGQSVPYRDLRVSGQFFHDLLSVAPVFNTVEHAGQYPGRIGDTLLFADLGSLRIQIGRPHAQVMARDLKGTAGPGAGLLKDQGNVPALKITVGDSLFLLILEIGSQIQQIEDLFFREVQEL